MPSSAQCLRSLPVVFLDDTAAPLHALEIARSNRSLPCLEPQMRIIKCVLAACLTLLIVSCGSHMQEYIVTNNTTLNLLCDARIDNTAIPCGALGAGGTKGSFIHHIDGTWAHFRMIVEDHSQPNSNVDIDLSKIPAGEGELHFDIMSLHEVKAYYKKPFVDSGK